MKKNLKQALSVLAAASLLASVMPMTVLAAKSTVAELDTFDSYPAVELTSDNLGPVSGYDGGNTDINAGDVVLALDEDEFEVWSAEKSIDGNWWCGWGNASAGIIANPTVEAADGDNVLAIEGRTVWNSYTATPKVRYDAVSVGKDTEYIYQFDFYRAGGAVGNGIRFNMNSGNYYELVFDGDNSETSTSQRTKVLKNLNGTVSVLDAVVSTNTNIVTGEVWTKYNRLQDGKWYTLELSVYEGNISWTVTYAENGQDNAGAVVQTGSCVDSTDPIDTDNMQLALFARGQGGQFVYFDNFSIMKNVEIEDDGSFSALSLTTETVNRDETTLTGIQASSDADKQLAGRWNIKQSKDGQMAGYDGNAVFAIANDPVTDGTHGNVLKIEARAAMDDPGSFPMAYNTRMGTVGGQNYLYQFDICREAGGGIRFNYSGEGNDASYYELFFTNSNDAEQVNGTVLTKKVNGERTVLAADIQTYSSIGGEYWTNSNTLIDNKWYSVDLVVADGVIYWEITDAAGLIVQTGSYDDSQAPVSADNMQTVFFGACQGNQYVHFDNITIGTIAADKGNFNGYTAVTGKVSEYADKVLAYPYFIKQSKSGQAANPETVYAITTDPLNGTRGNVLQIESRCARDIPSEFPMVYNKNWNITESGKYVYKFDYLRNSGDAGGGIRFNYSGSTTEEGGDANYYELFFVRDTGVQLAKCENGVYTTVTPTVETNQNTSFTYWSGMNGLRPNVWSTIELIVDNGNISWTVSDGEVGWWQSGSYVDANPLPDANTQPALFSAGQYNNHSYFDNISITPIVDDNGTFEKQALTEAMQAPMYSDARLSGNWFMRGNYDHEYAGYDWAAKFAIAENPAGDGKTLRIEARAAMSDAGGVPMVYNETWKTNSAEKTTYQFDYRTDDDRIAPIFRFNYSKTDDTTKSFYQLAFEGTNGSSTTTLAKVTDGKASEMVSLSPEITGETALKASTWYTVKLTAEGGSISWTVTNTADGTVVQTGSYTDAAPITGTNLMTMFGAQGNGGNYVYYDNVTCTTGDVVEDYAITGYADGKATIEAPEANTTATVIFAAYASGKLTSVSYATANLVAGVNEVIPAETFSSADADTVVIMLWDGMAPLCAAYPYTAK